jgi:hypothetical protein
MKAGRRLGWLLFGLSVTSCTIGTVLITQVPASRLKPGDESLLLNSAFLFMTVVFAFMGAVIIARLPANPIGWLFIAVGVFMAAEAFTYCYAAYALAAEPNLPGGVASAWVSSWVYYPAVLGLTPTLFLLFPDGRPVSPRWRWVLPLIAIGITCQVAGVALAPGGMSDSPVPQLQNPVGLEAEGIAFRIEITGLLIGALGVLLATWSLIVRWRGARGDRRQQLKWFAWSAGLVASYPLTVTLVTWGADPSSETSFYVTSVSLPLVLSAVPVAAGLAILRYRLYDIDVLINRTLVYGAVTITLGLAYLVSVLLLRLALQSLTGESDLAVAGSTLTVAALFRPLRTGIQTLVDQHFYRRRYDAARTLEAFSARLRNELDISAQGNDLRNVVLDTLQPTSVTLWLKPSASHDGQDRAHGAVQHT